MVKENILIFNNASGNILMIFVTSNTKKIQKHYSN